MKQVLTIFLIISIVVTATSCALDYEKIVISQNGGVPKWSPSGERLALKSGSNFIIYEMETYRSIATINSVKNKGYVHFYCWIGEDSLAVTYIEKERIKGLKTSIYINSILDFSGNYTEIVRDTSFRYKTTSIGPWSTLANGTVGYYTFQRINQKHKRNKLFSIKAGLLIESEPEETKPSECEQKFSHLRSRYELILSPNCELALAFRDPDYMMSILDTLGNEMFEIKPRYIRTDQNKSLGFGKFQWSFSSKHLTLKECLDDGHTVFKDNLYLIDVHNQELIQLTDFNESHIGGVVWSPDKDEFIVVSNLLGGVVLFKMGDLK